MRNEMAKKSKGQNPAMSLFAKLSIKRKLVIIIMMVSSAAMLAAGGSFITYQWLWVFPQRMVNDLSAQADMVAENCTGSLSFNDSNDAEGVLASLRAKDPIAVACVYREGKPFAQYRRLDFKGDVPQQPPVEPGYHFQGQWLVMVKPVIFNGETIGTVYLKSDLRELRSFLKGSIIALLLMVLLTSIPAYILSSKLQKVISTPLLQLTEISDGISQNEDYSVRAVKQSADEVGRLTDAFNNMLEQVEKRDQALRENEERFQAIADYTYDWESWHGISGKLRWVNPAIERLTGYDIAECLVMENYPLPMIHEDDRDKIKLLLAQAASERTTGTDIEFRLLHKDGSLYWGSISWQPIYDWDKNCLGFRTSVRDVTSRKEAEFELQRLRSLLSNIVNSMPSVLVGVDTEGRVTQWNHEAERVTGVMASEAQGRELHDVYPQLAGEMEKVRQAIIGRETKKDQKVAYQANGETRFTDVTVYPLIANCVEGAVIRVDDVTERVRIEEMMIQSEKMLSVGGLAAGMAHEINNPLAGILQNAQVMRNRFKNKMPKNIRTAEECGTNMDVISAYMEKRGLLAMLESIMESGRRAAQIVDNMLSFSRKSESKREYAAMSTLLEKTIELASNDYDLKKKYDFRQIEIIRQYDDEVPEVLCEGSKIQQVFLNILKNGAQAMAEKRKEGETSRFTLRVKRDGDMARIEIEDNGPGMEENTRKRIFEPFFTTKGVGVGTGLGLSVSYFIINENHKGTMNVESSPGQGTTFIILLPIDKNQN